MRVLRLSEKKRILLELLSRGQKSVLKLVEAAELCHVIYH